MKKRSRRVVQTLIAVFALVSAATPAKAIPVQFLEIGTSDTGFSPSNFPTPVDLVIPLDANDRPAPMTPVTGGYGLNMTTCILANEPVTSGCDDRLIPGSTGFTMIVDITLATVPVDAVGMDSFIFFSALPAVPTYSVTDISFIVDDPTPVPGHTITPFTTASFTPTLSMTYYFLGFILSEGESATFRVDVTGDHSMANPVTDKVVFRAAGYVIPEPSTAVLVGLGLLVLARRRSR